MPATFAFSELCRVRGKPSVCLKNPRTCLELPVPDGKRPYSSVYAQVIHKIIALRRFGMSTEEIADLSAKEMGADIRRAFDNYLQISPKIIGRVALQRPILIRSIKWAKKHRNMIFLFVCFIPFMNMESFGKPLKNEKNVACLGQIVPGERVLRIAAPPEAIIGELHVRRGSRVAKGDVIAVLRNASVYKAQVEHAEQKIALAKAELEQIRKGERHELIAAQESLIAAHQAETSLLELRLERYKSLLEEKFVSQDQFDETVSLLDGARGRQVREQRILESLRSGRAEEIAKAEIAVALAEARAAEFRASLELQYIRAFSDGEILDIHAWPGENVGEKGTIATMGDTTNIMVIAEVYETDLPRIKTGARALIEGQAFEGKHGGEVVEIQRFFEGSAVFPMDPASYVDRRIVSVRIRPDNPAALSAFIHAHVTITILTP